MSEEESSDDKKNLDFSKDVKEKPAKPKRVASRFFNALLAVVFFILFVMSVVSFSSFSNNYRKITGTVYGDRACVLYATYNEDNDQNIEPKISLGAVGFCRLGIGGEVVIAIYCILSIVVMVIKIIGGWSILSCFLVFELITVFVMTLLSFCIGVVISVGRKVTCDNLENRKDQGGASSCSGYTVPESTFEGGEKVQFLKEIEIAEATAWLGFGILVVILVFYIICVVMYGYGRKQAKTAKKNAIDKEKAKNQKELEDKA